MDPQIAAFNTLETNQCRKKDTEEETPLLWERTEEPPALKPH